MIKNIRIIRILLILAILLSPFTNQIKADICIRTFENDTLIAKAIFTGKVVDKIESKFWHNSNPASITTFEIIESYKGLFPNISYLTVLGPLFVCCNKEYQLDSTYLIFAYSQDNTQFVYYTLECSQTGLLSGNKHLISRLPPPIGTGVH